MRIRRGLFAVLAVSGCGPLEIGSYPARENDASGGTTARGGSTPLAGTASLGGTNPSGGDAGNGAGGGAGLGGATTGGFGGSSTPGGGFANGGLAGSGFGGASGAAGDGVGVAGFGGGNESGAGGAGESFGGGGSGAGSEGDGSGGSVAGGGFGGSSTGGRPDGVLNQSCLGLEGQCSAHFDCCASSYVDTEEFVLGWDEFSVNARVTKFYPDALEVTVGRFANFVAAYEAWIALGSPHADAGEHTFIEGTGWQTDWSLPVSRDALEQSVTSCAFETTYSFKDTDPELPMNCVSWFEAFAFCIWDGKRLLTEAEWELAAKGGKKDRVFPWGDAEPTPDHAVYGCYADGLGAPHCEAADILHVGSRPLGNSWYGLRDMAGSVAEWVFDKEDPYTDPCFDCANTESEHNPTFRMYRGGGYTSAPVEIATETRGGMDAAQGLNWVGFRCARSLLR